MQQYKRLECAHSNLLKQGSAICAGSAVLLSPTYAFAITPGELFDRATSSPLACFGMGAVTGVVVMAVVSHGLHKSEIRRMIERIEALEIAQEKPAVSHTSEFVPVTAKHDNEQVSADVEDAGKEDTTRITSRRQTQGPQRNALQDVETALNERLNPTALGDLPVIERGERPVNSSSTAPMEQLHKSQVMQRLDRTTRAKIIAKRIPTFDALETAQQDQVQPAEKKKTERVEWTTPDKFDSNGYVEQIWEEEYARHELEAMKDFSHSKLKVFEGTGDLSSAKQAIMAQKSQSQRPHGRHFAPMSKEA